MTSPFLPQYCTAALQMCKMGATDMDLARAFDVSFGTIKKWQVQYQAFADACRVGKDHADERVQRALFQRAVGYEQPATKILVCDKMVGEIDYIEHHPPDVGAAKYWLNNRRPDEWADKTQAQITGKDGKDLVPPAAKVDLSSMPDELLTALKDYLTDASPDASGS